MLNYSAIKCCNCLAHQHLLHVQYVYIVGDDYGFSIDTVLKIRRNLSNIIA